MHSLYPDRILCCFSVAMVGTASKGISYLSGDADYIRKREMRRQKSRALKGGIVEGIVEGGENVFSGFKSGFTGLLTKPIREAQKDGLEGFIRGVGMGLVGAAVKPVLGLADGITSVASGVQNQVDVPDEYTIRRPARALESCQSDSTKLAVGPVTLDGAHARDFIIKRAESHGYRDSFLGFLSLNDETRESVILSEIYIFWRRPHNLWGRTWANISHCVLTTVGVCIVLYAGKDGQYQLVDIPCPRRSIAVRLYTLIVQNSERMGYPALTLPVDKAIEALGHDESFGTLASYDSKESLENVSPRDRPPPPPIVVTSPIPDGGIPKVLKKIFNSTISLKGELDGYRFGQLNNKVMQPITGPESDVLLRASASLTEYASSWRVLDERVRRVIWEWDCVHKGLSASRCCATVFINLSSRSVQLSRVQQLLGRGFALYGSEATGCDPTHRLIRPGGRCVLLLWANTPSPLDVGHLKTNVYSTAFSMTIASTQMETLCKPKEGFQVGLLEKAVAEWWSKYVVLIHS